MGPKAGKCRCHNPEWKIHDVWERQFYQLGVTLRCATCNAVWKTVSRGEYRNADFNVVIRFGYSKTYNELFSEMDKKRKEYLEEFIIGCEEQIAHLEKSIANARREQDCLDATMTKSDVR